MKYYALKEFKILYAVKTYTDGNSTYPKIKDIHQNHPKPLKNQGKRQKH